MYRIDFHADDYAASPDNSRRILELLLAGKVDSISILPNMGCYEECMKMLRENWERFPKKPLLSVHLNLIDGYWLSSGKSKRCIRNSWERLFLYSLVPGPKRKQLKLSYSRELAEQLSRIRRDTKDLKDDEQRPVAFRIDSHVHTHMIPLVFEALEEALAQTQLRAGTSFIRCSTEPLAMFLFTPGIAGTIRPLNLVKNIVLHVLSHGIRNKLEKEGIQTGRIFGVAMTGRMDSRRVGLLMNKMRKYARKKDAHLEILCHPGRVSDNEKCEEYGPDDTVAFVSDDRDLEYEMLMELAGGKES
ncbi:MAG: ChbG/HpnK family deacetylase [Lachnospiraceae bacterium]|nr:ChbG/HpnK family deacetylase [Lachnospiraceae bacterium]